MLTFIIGHANSGKSDYAENLVSKLDGPTSYIGTLPRLDVFEQRIQRHVLRRPSTWRLIELIGNPSRDFHLLLETMERSQNVLLDGLAFYVFHLVTVLEFDWMKFDKQTRRLTKAFSKHKGHVIVVDQPVAPIECRKTAAVLQRLHIVLARRADEISLISKSISMALEARELVEVDRFALPHSETERDATNQDSMG